MKEQFCTYEIALKLKELGFNEECLASYFEWPIPDRGTFELSLRGTIHAPFWQQAIDWFREKYDLHIVVTVNPYSEIDEVNGYKIYDGYKNMQCVSNQETQSWSHYKAREQAILKCIELCKKEK